MKRFRYRQSLIAGVILILATNAFVLAGVAYNRSGDPESSIVLTERELRLPFQYQRNDENSGIHLRLSVRNARRGGYFVSARYSEDTAWLDKEKLELLGFDMSRPVISDEDKRYYRNMKEKEVILVLENDGETHKRIVERTRKTIADLKLELVESGNNKRIENELHREERNLAKEEVSASRLSAVDAGFDAAMLRNKYSDKTKYILMKGIVSVGVRHSDNGVSSAVGYVQALSNPNVYVPLSHHDLLQFTMDAEASRKGSNHPPRYQVTLNLGNRLEPWLVDVKELENE